MRYALRSLARARLISIITIVSLGVAMGVTTTLFAVIDAMRHPPDAIRGTNGLYELSISGRNRDAAFPRTILVRTIAREARFADAIAVERWMGAAVVRTPIDQHAVAAAHVTANYFEVVGAVPEVGHLFGAADTSSLAPESAVISHQLWHALFGGKKDLRDARILLNDSSYAVAAVLPPSWQAMGYPSVLVREHATTSGATTEFVRMFARLRPGVTVAQANAEIRTIVARFGSAAEGKSIGAARVSAGLRSFSALTFSVAGFQVALGGAALLVLAIACANVAILLLVRATSRANEMAVRSAMGADSSRLIGIVLAEGAMLTAAAAALGLLLATWLIHLCKVAIPDSMQAALGAPRLSVAVFAFAIAAGAMVTVLTGLTAALRVARADPIDVLRDSPVMTSGRVKREVRGFIVAELALSFLLLAGVGLVARSIIAEGHFDFGINLHGLYRTELSPWDASQILILAQQGRVDSIERQRYEAEQRLNIEMRQAVLGVPGVLAAGSILAGVSVPAQTVRSEQASIRLERYNIVSTGFLHVVGLGSGLAHPGGYRVDQRAAVINTILARRLYGSREAVGRQLWLGNAGRNEESVTIAAVTRPFALDVVPGAEVAHQGELYVVDDTIIPQGSDLLIRSASDDPSLPRSIARTLGEISPRARFSPVLLVRDQNQILIDRQTFAAMLGGGVSAFGLMLSLIGLYGVVAFAVAQRRREFALRAAFGASPRQIASLALREGLALLLAGTSLGLAITAITGRIIAVAVYGSHAEGPGYALPFATTVILTTLAATASWLSARQAADVNAASLLRGGP